MSSVIYYAAAGAAGGAAAPPVIATPVLAEAPVGSNAGAAIVSHAAGFAMVFDTLASSSSPTALGGGWTSRAAFSNTSGDNVVSCRLSTKVVTLNEGIPACTGGSRRSVRIYTDCSVATPIVDVETAEGKGNTATVPYAALTLDGDGNVLVGFARRVGSGTFTWASPTANQPHNQNTSAVAGSADSLTKQTSAVDLTMSIGTNNDWVAVSVALGGA
jgi:hypothetical protein